MPVLTCNACNTEFKDDSEQKLHYKSEWHRYNLKRKVAGVPGVTEGLFLARQSALAREKDKSNETPMLYSCGLCGKGYKSAKAHAEHLKSRSHMMRASEGASHLGEKVIIKPIQQRVVNRPPPPRKVVDNSAEDEDSEDEWEEVGSEDEMVDDAAQSLTDMNVNEHADNVDMDEDDDSFELDPSCCFMCDQDHGSIENCMVHMHKHHGFFIPDVEYLKDPKGFLTYLGLKVKRDYMCLYCNDRCYPFSSLEAVRKHMEAKRHCKVHFGDGDDDEEAELEEFYDYSSSYVDEQGKQLVVSGDADSNIELGGGSELIITKKSGDRKSTITLGSREFLRYYRQKPRPSLVNGMAITAALASRYKSMGLATVQSREKIVRMKVLKEMNRSGVDYMRSKMAMKSNVIRNLPNNVPY